MQGYKQFFADISPNECAWKGDAACLSLILVRKAKSLVFDKDMPTRFR